MREKIISLAKGEFVYATPELVLPETPLAFSVVSGTRKTFTFSVSNTRGSRVRGFGVVEDVHIEFLPFFEQEKNELTLEVNAEELRPGELLQGELLLETDCGEATLPYKIDVVAPVLEDEKGLIRDYHVLCRRMQENPEHGVDLFLSEGFQQTLLYGDESGQIAFDILTKKNTKLQAMEEFLVATEKKEAIRFQLHHSSGESISYEMDGVDIQDTISVKVNTWGHTGIQVSSTADFIQPNTPMLWTDEFGNGQDILEYTIVADKVPNGRRVGQIIFQSPYEKKTIQVEAHNQKGENQRRLQRAKKNVLASMIRMYLAYTEKTIRKYNFIQFLKKNRQVLEQVLQNNKIALNGYISIILNEEEGVLSFFQEAEKVPRPSLEVSAEEVENYITIEFIKFLYTKQLQDKEYLTHLIEIYEEGGYHTSWMSYIRAQVDSRYRSLRLLEKDIRQQLESGSNAPYLYSVMMLAYREDATLIAILDKVTVKTVKYGLKHDLINEEVAMAVSFLGERLSYYDSMVFGILEELYALFGMKDTLHAICSMLIRGGIHKRKYFDWFAKGVAMHLRLTDLFEYYMYTLDSEKKIVLPDSVLSYFQYENHLNDSCKAFLYSYIIKNKNELPEFYRAYQEQIKEFGLRRLSHGRVSENLSVIYHEIFGEEQMQGEVARQLAGIMFSYGLWCDNKSVDKIVVVHKESRGEREYSLENGYAQIEIFTPNAQVYFVDEKGRYFCGTVDCHIEKFMDLEQYAEKLYKGGADATSLLVYLAFRAERSPRLTEDGVGILRNALNKKILRDKMQQKVLMRLYDYYKKAKNISGLLEILDRIEPQKVKRSRLGEVAADCIYQGMFDKATELLCRGGIRQCETDALSMLIADLIEKNNGEFEPLLAKWALHLYREKRYDKAAMEYLLRYYMGDVTTLTKIYQKCQEMPEVIVGEEANERLLAQLLFVGDDLTRFESVFLKYYENGENRMLVKAFLSQLAYEYVVEQVELSEEIFVKIEKEAMYEKDLVMVLAALRYYRGTKNFAGKQKEFVELNLERYAGEGLILAFMKDYIGKVNVPYEIENCVLVQFYSGTDRGVFLCEETSGGRVDTQAMKEVFPGIFTRELMLFDDEEKHCYIYEEESNEKTEVMLVKRTKSGKDSPGFFAMINEMIEASQEQDSDSCREVQREYEHMKYLADKLFQVL